MARLDRSAQLALRRMQLRAQCELQRKALAEQAKQIEHELSRIDRGVAIVRSFVTKPTLVVAAVAALALIGPGRALRWMTRGAMWYGVAKRVLGSYGALRRTRIGTNELAVDG